MFIIYILEGMCVSVIVITIGLGERTCKVAIKLGNLSPTRLFDLKGLDGWGWVVSLKNDITIGKEREREGPCKSIEEGE